MDKHQFGTGQQNRNISSPSEETIQGMTITDHRREMVGLKPHEHEDPLARASGKMLDKADTYIYAIVGVCFLLGALFALAYTFWALGVAVIDLPHYQEVDQPVHAATAIIEFVSGLLLVLIIMEVLGTVVHYLKSHETSLRPFLFIGIVSATRSILSIGARLAVVHEPATGVFQNAMIELGVSAAVVLVLGITLKLLGNLVDPGSSNE